MKQKQDDKDFPQKYLSETMQFVTDSILDKQESNSLKNKTLCPKPKSSPSN